MALIRSWIRAHRGPLAPIEAGTDLIALLSFGHDEIGMILRDQVGHDGPEMDTRGIIGVPEVDGRGEILGLDVDPGKEQREGGEPLGQVPEALPPPPGLRVLEPDRRPLDLETVIAAVDQRGDPDPVPEVRHRSPAEHSD